MTAQIAEILRYKGADVDMCTNPLDDYSAMGGVVPTLRIELLGAMTRLRWSMGNYRWPALSGRVARHPGGRSRSIGCHHLSGLPGRVFAHWYSEVVPEAMMPTPVMLPVLTAVAQQTIGTDLCSSQSLRLPPFTV